MGELLQEVVGALKRLRAPLCQGEYDLHSLVASALSQAGISYAHEVPLAPRCRIDFLVGDVGIEIKKGKPRERQLLVQMEKYAMSPAIGALVVLVERSANLPLYVCGKPCVILSINRLWGIAL